MFSHADVLALQNIGEDTSTWTLRQDAFGQTWELSWVAKNLPPVPYAALPRHQSVQPRRLLRSPCVSAYDLV